MVITGPGTFEAATQTPHKNKRNEVTSTHTNGYGNRKKSQGGSVTLGGPIMRVGAWGAVDLKERCKKGGRTVVKTS